MQTTLTPELQNDFKQICKKYKLTYIQLCVCLILYTFKCIFFRSPLAHFEKPRPSVGKQRQLLQHYVFGSAELLSEIHYVPFWKKRKHTQKVNWKTIFPKHSDLEDNNLQSISVLIGAYYLILCQYYSQKLNPAPKCIIKLRCIF